MEAAIRCGHMGWRGDVLRNGTVESDPWGFTHFLVGMGKTRWVANKPHEGNSRM